jgi:HPt (histidine-containing phosphotransfer) domain-containing protein
LADLPVGSEERPTFDAAALDRLERFGGRKLLSEMIALFLAAAPERISAARQGVEKRDVAAVEMALHSLKSSSAQLGAMHMQRLSERGERAAMSGTVDNVGPVVQELEEEFVRVKEWLTSVRDGGTA